MSTTPTSAHSRTSSGVDFSPTARREQRKKHGYGFRNSKSPKNKNKNKNKLTNEELMAKIGEDLKKEQDVLEHELDVGQKAAAVTLQANARGGLMRDELSNLGKQAGAITLQSVQRGHSQRKEVKDPFLFPLENPEAIADSAARMLTKLETGIEPMLQFEDRTSVVWETKGWKDLHKEKLRSRGKWTDADEKADQERKEAERIARQKMSKETSKILDHMDELHANKRGAARVGGKDRKIAANPNKLGLDHDWGQEKAEKGVVVEWVKNPRHSLNAEVQTKISNHDMMVWLGKAKKDELPLDKDIREQKRQEKFSVFASFVDESLKLLDDFEERELMLKGVDMIKRKGRDMIYNDEKMFADCIFREQLRHEKLHNMPLCSQRKFQESCENYKRDEKELKILMATIRRIDKFDCTFLSCKLTNSHIDNVWCNQISKALNGNEFLQQLYLSGNYIGDEGMGNLANIMEKNWAVKILNLAGNLISDDGAYRIAEMLKVNKHLVDLNLEYHEKKRPYRDKDKPYPRISAPGGAMISFALQSNYSLTSLNLKGQRLWDAGVCAVASMLRENRTLKHLNLSDNDVKRQGGMALASALEVNEALEHLNIAQNSFEDDVGMKFADALMQNDMLETLDFYENHLSLLSIRELREAAKGNPSLRAISAYGNKMCPRKNDPQLDNLVETNILRWKEDKRIKNLIIWHKRTFEKNESRDHYDHFLEWQFGVLKDPVDGTLFDVDLAKQDYRDKTANTAHALGTNTAQPTNPMNNLQLKMGDSKVLATAPTRLPEITIDVWKEDMNGETMESRLWDAWGQYTAKTEAESSLGGVNVKAHNDSSNPFYDSLTRLMQLRIPIPGRPFQDGTISVCRLQYLKEEKREERVAVGRAPWYKKQKASNLNWKDHIHARVNLPPDQFVDHQYQLSFPHKYPSGIDASYNAKINKVKGMIKGFTGGTMLSYRGLSEEEIRQREMDKKMQQMNLDGVDEKDRKIALRRAGGGKILTSGDLDEELRGGPRRMTSSERQRKNSKAHVGQPKFGGKKGGLVPIEEGGVQKRLNRKSDVRDVKARRGGLMG
ncbi:hypothetical protein TrLO_g7965 [Triparma laevis f. longispina]|uniref:Uncharacterized protein n=1 Tax=Triparma laevis f. longispina TaxID=1714387 RepID=A0A9W7KVN8_9STRA|nr:hypothetical protein TrLO_g7965 [Triparma laevis f. longispina]